MCTPFQSVQATSHRKEQNGLLTSGQWFYSSTQFETTINNYDPSYRFTVLFRPTLLQTISVGDLINKISSSETPNSDSLLFAKTVVFMCVLWYCRQINRLSVSLMLYQPVPSKAPNEQPSSQSPAFATPTMTSGRRCLIGNLFVDWLTIASSKVGVVEFNWG